MIREQEAIKQIRGKLLDYLKEYHDDGERIQINEHFTCPSPDHEDSSPSAIIQDRGSDDYSPEIGYCFGCHTSFNIFTLAHWYQSLPLEGHAFWRVTLPTLADEFDIEYEPEALSEEDKKEIVKYRAYNDAATVIVAGAKYVENAIKERGWSLELARRLKFGGILSTKEYLDQMKNLGWSEPYLRSIQLLGDNDTSVIQPHRIIFAIHDQYGQVCAFASRKIDDTEEGPKYLNSENSDIYQKRNILYNLYRLKKNDTSIAYVVEGYADAISLIANGHERVVALGGTALTEEHVELLYSWGVKTIHLLFDGDEAGALATKRAINHLSQNSQFNAKVVVLPEDEDPDSYLKSGRKLSSREKITPFEWTIRNVMDDPETDAVELATEMISGILMEPNMMKREQMIDILANATDIDRAAISSQVRKCETERSFEKKEKENKLRQKLGLWLKQDGKTLDTILSRARTEWDEISKAYDVRTEAGPDSYVRSIEEIKESLMTRDEISGFRLSRFGRLMTDLGGVPDTEALIVMAGKPNIGKTSWLRFLMLDLVKSNEDIFVLNMSIDDSRSRQIPSLVATMKRLNLSEAFRPQSITDPERRQKWNDAFDKLTNGWSSKFAIEDQTTGSTVDALQKHIELYKRHFPDKKMLVILDNFHRLTDGGFGYGSTQREKTLLNSNRIKNLTTTYNIPIIMTAELRKVAPGRRPTEEDIAETNQLNYDSDLTMLLHNDLTENPASSIWWQDHDMKRPRLEVRVVKNKLSDFKSWWIYDYDHTTNYFRETSDLEHQQTIGQIIKEITRTKRASEVQWG